MAIDLPSVNQEWQADASPYVVAMDEIVSAAQAAAAANRDLIASLGEVQAAVDALHGKDITIGVDAATGAAAAAAAAVNDLGRAQTQEAAAADASAAAAAAAAAAVNEMAAAEERAAAAAGDVAARVAEAAAAIARFDAYQKETVASAAEAATAITTQGAATRILAYSDYQAAAASAEATKAAIGQAAAEDSVAAAVAAARDRILGYTAANYLAAAAQAKLAIEGAGVWSVITSGEEKATAGAAASGVAFRGLWGILGAMNAAAIPLFGGAGFFGIMKTVSGIHLLVDSVAELLAVLIPAGVALAAFGAAAAPTVQSIVHQMQNLYTVTTATGQSLYPLTGGFQRVAAAVQPSVYTLFGEALLVINSRMGTFQSLATQTGSVLDQLGARASAALLSSGMSQFLHNAAADVQMLGTLFGNVFGIIGNVLRTLPGYAQPLLAALVGITHALESVTASGAVQGLLSIGLAMHGAILWAGLLATAVLKLGPMMWGWIEPAINRIVALGVAFAMTADQEGLLVAATAALDAVNPLVWIAAAVALVAGLAVAFGRARSATQQWTSSLEQGLMNASAGITGLSTMMNDQVQVANRTATAQRQYGQALASTAKLQTQGMAGAQAAAAITMQARNNLLQLTGTQAILNDQQRLYAYRLHVLTGALGSSATAMGMLAASGVKMSQMLTGGKNALAQIEAQVLGTAAAYRAMGQTGGMLGADMSVMNILASDQYNAVQKLNQAWQTWIGVVTGGMQALSQFETALTGMKSDAAAASAGLSGAIGSIKQGVGGMTYTLKGFGPAAMQSWQQFTSAVNQGNTVIAQMRTYMALGAVSGGQFTNTIKALVAQMIPFAQGNKAALTMLENLALQAGGPATNNLRALAQWAGVSGNAAKQQLAKGLEAATIAGGQLGQVAMHLSATLNTDLANAVSAAALKASGLTTALNALGTQVSRGATFSTGFHGTLAPVIADMVKLHQDVPSITAYLQGMGVQIDQAQVKAILAAAHLSTMGGSAAKAGGQASVSAGQVRALAAAINALRSKTITITTNYVYHGSLHPGGPGMVGGIGGHTMAAQHGGVLPGFQPGHDIVPAMLSPGEAILNPYATRALGADWVHAMNTMAERGAVNPAALRMGGSAPGLGAGPADRYGGGDIVVNVDGEQLFKIMMRRGYKYQTSNSGTRTGLSIPGNRVG